MLATQDVWPSSTAYLTNEERRERLKEKARVIDALNTSLAQEAAEFAATDAWEEEGSASAIDWIRFNCNMTSNAAADLIAVGKNLQRMSSTVEAVIYEGEIVGSMPAAGANREQIGLMMAGAHAPSLEVA